MPNTNNSSNPNELVLSITAETSQAKKDFETLRKSIEELGKEFGRLKRTDTSIEIAEEINKAQNPLKKALLFLTEIQKKIADTQKKRDKAFAIGANVEKLDKELEGYRQREKEIVRGIQDSLKVGALHKQELQINKQIRAEQKADFQARVLQNQKEIEQRKELLETNKKIATQQLISAISDVESGNRAEINRQIIEDRPVKSAAESAQVFIEQYAKADEALRNFELSLDPVKQKMAAVQQALQNARDRFVEFYRVGDDEGLKSAEKDIKQLSKELGKLQTNTKGASSWWGKLVGRIRNISIYRAIRTGLRWITSGFREGLDNLSQYSDSVNDTMSNLNGSLNQIKNTMGIAFASILQALEPVLTALADTIINIVNAFNLAMAKMSGKNVYTKAKKNVDDYSKSLQKAQKFSFDTFEVLSGGEQTSPSDMFDEKEIPKEENELSQIFESFLNVIKSIFEEFKRIWNSMKPILKPLLSAINSVIKPLSDVIISILPIISDLIITSMPIIAETLSFIADLLKKLSPIFSALVNVLKSIFSIIDSIFPIFKSLVDIILPPIKLALDITSGKIGIIAKGIEAIASILGVGENREDMPWWKRLLSALLNPFAMLQEMANVLSSSGSSHEIYAYANGGFTTANFIATNENGRREWVGRNAGVTAVVNDTQMSDIMYGAVREGCYEGILQAMYNNGSGQSGNSSNITIQVDKDILGRVVAESVGFRNEANRRNPALNLR